MALTVDQLWMSFGSLLGLFAFIQSILPPDYRDAVSRLPHSLFHYLSLYTYFEVHETSGIASNELYDFIQIYLSSSASSFAQRATVSLPKNSQSLAFGLTGSGNVSEVFNGAQLLWMHHSQERQNSIGSLWSDRPDEKRYYVLRMRKKDREKVLKDYFSHITDQAKRLKFAQREKKLYTNVSDDHSFRSSRKPWQSVPFKHPSTFQTLALDPARKEEIMKDLEAFRGGEEFYRSVGRSWKRGYLLYGPPGTGKSSMIAAIANFMDYDVYDLELTEVKSNAQLRKLLIHTSNKSVIVIEDIDCSLNLSNRAKAKKQQPTEGNTSTPSDANLKGKKEEEETKVTLSGLLNFTDGLWSCCGSERIIIFTTNHKERLDPALLRSGRMDKHIHMSYCTFPAFKILAKNYLGSSASSEHRLLEEIEAIIEEAMMTPADISEILIEKRENVREAMKNVIGKLKAAKEKPNVEESAKDVGEEEE